MAAPPSPYSMANAISEGVLRDPPSRNDIRIAPAVIGIALVATASYFTIGATAGAAGSSTLFGTASTGWTVAGTVSIALDLGGVAKIIAGTQKGLSSSESADSKP